MRFVCGRSGINRIDGGKKNPEDLLHVSPLNLRIGGEQLLFVLNTKSRFSSPVALKKGGPPRPGHVTQQDAAPGLLDRP